MNELLNGNFVDFFGAQFDLSTLITFKNGKPNDVEIETGLKIGKTTVTTNCKCT
jgi:hypothetical protein